MYFYIIFPGGNLDKIKVVPIDDYEVGDYKLASRHKFFSETEAVPYAKALAKAHEKKYIPLESETNLYLD